MFASLDEEGKERQREAELSSVEILKRLRQRQPAPSQQERRTIPQAHFSVGMRREFHPRWRTRFFTTSECGKDTGHRQTAL